MQYLIDNDYDSDALDDDIFGNNDHESNIGTFMRLNNLDYYDNIKKLVEDEFGSKHVSDKNKQSSSTNNIITNTNINHANCIWI